MNDFLKVNEFGKAFGLDRVVEFQQDLIKQATEVNKKFAVECLKTAKAAVDIYARNLESEIKRLDNTRGLPCGAAHLRVRTSRRD